MIKTIISHSRQYFIVHSFWYRYVDIAHTQYWQLHDRAGIGWITRLTRHLTNVSLFTNWMLNSFALHHINWSFTKLQFVNYGTKTHYWFIRVTCHFVAISVTVLRKRVREHAATIRHRPVEVNTLWSQTSWMFSSESRWRTCFRQLVSWS